MPSPAAVKYGELTKRASVLLKANRNRLTQAEIQEIYGASFVAQVAAWNAYVVELVRCFYRETADASTAKYMALHTLAEAAASRRIEKFNTPNAEKTRELVTICTGYDPWTDWQWPAKRMNVLAVRLRLNEILQVRHSLAHGFSMPGYPWNQTPAGQVRLTLRVLTWTRGFMNHLVSESDRGLAAHMIAAYGIAPNW